MKLSKSCSWIRSLVAVLFSLVCAVPIASCGPSYRNIVLHDLPATDSLTCQGYLVWNQDPVRDVFLVINGSGILSNAFVDPTFEGVLSQHAVAYATYDKPGVHARFGDPASVRRDDALLERYTLGHGVACATNALRWIHERLGPSVRLHIRAHSEGTLVALYTYDALLQQNDDITRLIDTLVLSGLALDPFDTILQRQLDYIPNGAELRAALASCNWPVLEPRLGISCAYVADATQRPSGRTMFERLAARGTRARFYVFQGTSDWNTPVDAVRALEAWNASDGRLRMEFHYYDGGHAGTDAARAELERVVTALVSEP